MTFAQFAALTTTAEPQFVSRYPSVEGETIEQRKAFVVLVEAMAAGGAL
jgi:hypothetical protein